VRYDRRVPKPKKTEAVATAVAFLRGVNVGGNNVVPMAKVVSAFEALGFGAVKSLGHAGNLLFDGAGANDATLEAKLMKGLKAKLKLECVVVVRQLDELRALVKAEPFGSKSRPEVTRYVAFLAGPPTLTVKLPIRDDAKGYELFERRELDVFALAWPIKGRSSFPILDKMYGVPATVRNWNTVEKLAR